MARYSLIFTGEMDEGVDRDDCTRELARLLNTDPDVIERSFFQHWPKTVIRADDWNKVESVRAAFSRAGAQVALHDEQADTLAVAAPGTPCPCG